MANNSASSTDQLVASGVDPKAAEAIIKLVETEVKSSVETEVRSLVIADQLRQREAARLPASKESIGWTGIIAIAVVLAFYWKQAIG